MTDEFKIQIEESIEKTEKEYCIKRIKGDLESLEKFKERMKKKREDNSK